MNKQTYDTMVKELKGQKNDLMETISKSQQIIQEHEQIIREAEQKLAELNTGIQFINKWFLNEEPEQLIKKGEISIASDQAELSIIELPLEDAVNSILDNEPDMKFTARGVKEILEAKEYPTRAKSFIDVVANSLRYLSRDGKIGFEKKGKFVTYYSLLGKENQTIYRPKPLPQIKGGLYSRNVLTEN
jgi:hypothetical protein